MKAGSVNAIDIGKTRLGERLVNQVVGDIAEAVRKAAQAA